MELAPSNLMILNHAEALQRLMDDEEILFAVYEVYVISIPQQIQEMHDGISTHNQELLIRAAHSIKGASWNVGAEIVGFYAAGLESAGKAGLTDQYEAFALQIEAAFTQASEAIQNISSR